MRTRASGSTMVRARPLALTWEPNDRHCSQAPLMVLSTISSSRVLSIASDMAHDFIQHAGEPNGSVLRPSPCCRALELLVAWPESKKVLVVDAFGAFAVYRRVQLQEDQVATIRHSHIQPAVLFLFACPLSFHPSSHRPCR